MNAMDEFLPGEIRARHIRPRVIVMLSIAAVVSLVLVVRTTHRPDPTKEAAKVAEMAVCRQHAGCWAEEVEKLVGERCRREIEQRAKLGHKWEPHRSVFTRARWVDREAGVLTLMGDRLSFQNAFDVWERQVYRCTHDPRIRSVEVVVAPGRLD